MTQHQVQQLAKEVGQDVAEILAAEKHDPDTEKVIRDVRDHEYDLDSFSVSVAY
jgi:hypothetical protein